MELMVLIALHIKINRSSAYLENFSELVDSAEELFHPLGLDFLFVPSVRKDLGMAWAWVRQQPAPSSQFLGAVW